MERLIELKGNPGQDKMKNLEEATEERKGEGEEDGEGNLGRLLEGRGIAQIGEGCPQEPVG